jgi:hypothetical protein
MDIVLMVFAMSQAQPLFEPPVNPKALSVEVVKVDTSTVDIHSNMWDPKWIDAK